jgi:hypothetical protein
VVTVLVVLLFVVIIYFTITLNKKDTTCSLPIGFPRKQKSTSIQSCFRKKTKGMFGLTVEKGIMGYGL